MPSPSRFLLVGNRLAVDFANTVYPDGVLTRWVNLVEFLEATGVVGAERATALKELEAGAPEEAGRVFKWALELRKGLREILEGLAMGRGAAAGAVEPINAVLRLTEGYDQLVPQNGRWRLEFSAREQRLEWLLAAIARSGAALVEEGAGTPVRKCADPKCELYFYDESRTGQRRWCTMASCGNRNKVAAFAQRRINKGRKARAAGAR